MKSVVVHDQNPIDALCEFRCVFDGLTVAASKGSVLNSGRYFGVRGETEPEKLEELDHVLFVAWTFGVALIACLAGVLPIDVDAVEVVLRVGGEDVLDKSFPVGGCGHGLREIA